MLNEFIMVGKINSIPSLNKDRENYVFGLLSEVEEYGESVVPIKINRSMAQNMIDYTKVGNVIGVKGKIVADNKKVILKASKITFLGGKNNA